MGNKLAYKLFGAFFLILAIAVCAMILSWHLFTLNFRTYIRQVEQERLETLLPALQEAYRLNGSWEPIAKDADAWRYRLDLAFAAGSRRRVPPPPPNEDPQGRFSKILLTDAHSRPLIGIPDSDDLTRIVPIEIEGRVVGWLGLKKREHFKSGPPAELLRRNSGQLLLLSSGVIALTALIALLFSRHLLRPIKLLTQGTQALAQRNFDVQIKPTTRDELAQLAENFNAMAHTLNRYEKMRQQWITDISHELRTPLSVLQGEIEALQDGVREPTSDNLASLQVEIMGLKRLVEDLHLISLADSDQLVLNRHAIAIHPLLVQITESYQPRLAGREIALELDLKALANVRLNADGDRLGQVFNNILDNALKYMRTPGVLKLTGRIEDGDLLLRFEDSGPGVPDEALGRLFDRLYRVETSRSRDSGGSGLGLSICREIIAHHQGEICAAPSPLGGLLIGIRLPIEVIRTPPKE